MRIGNPFRAELVGVSNWINEALDTMAARINAVFSVEHNDDGTHDVITATSIAAEDASSENGYYERDRDVALGEWIAVPYSASNFRPAPSSAATWTVDSADQATLAYTLIGNTMTVAFVINSTSISGFTASSVQIRIPGGYSVDTNTAAVVIAPIILEDNGTMRTGLVAAPASGYNTYLEMYRPDAVALAISANATSLRGQITFPIT